MPSINPSLTGSGMAQISGGTDLTILEVSPKMTVAGGLVDFDGNVVGVERIHHAGWVAIGEDFGGPLFSITWALFLNYPWQDFRFTDGKHFATTYFWDLTPGTTVELEIDW